MITNMLNGQIRAIIASEGGSLIDVNPGLIFWTVITFVLLLLILKKVAWKPILTALDQREAAIRESLEKARMAKEEAEKVLKENRIALSKADEESKRIVEQSRQYAEKLKEQILRESKELGKKIVADAGMEIERKKEEAFNELRTKVAEIAIQAAEKILIEKLDKESDKKIVNKYLNEIKQN